MPYFNPGQNTVNECSPNSCKNGGSCTDLVNGFSCSCVAGYNGDDCSSGKNMPQQILVCGLAFQGISNT